MDIERLYDDATRGMRDCQALVAKGLPAAITRRGVPRV